MMQNVFRFMATHWPGSGLDRSGSSDITKLTWARIAVRYDATGEHSHCTHQVPPKSGKWKKFFRTRAAHQKQVYPTLGNHPESLKNETISLISVDDIISVKLTRNGEPNNLYLHLSRDTLTKFIKRNTESCSWVRVRYSPECIWERHPEVVDLVSSIQ